LIGVIAKAGQTQAVEEFFQLFKTPWEFYRSGRAYEVVVTTDEVPKINPRLLVVYSAAQNDIDAHLGVVARGPRHGAILSDRDTSLFIYCELLTFAEGSNGLPCIRADSQIAGIKIRSSDSTVVRLGYDLFDEVRTLLSDGQPVDHAHVPTLDTHIRMLREWILDAGIGLLEIPPFPAQHRFVVCLTHDIDFIGIRRHRLDHSMWGFAYRATVGALREFVRGRLALSRLLRSWLAAASLPLVFAGWARDFWEPFEWYLEAERGLPSTYFFIPFKRRPGEHVPEPHASRRATAYDVADVPDWTAVLLKEGYELGVHGIDAWHNADKGRDELAAVTTVAGKTCLGIRMHWLLRNEDTASLLERAGYAYDSTFGYNETVGYRAGTSQVFRPLGAESLLELPLHIQDGALFFPQRLGLSEAEAEKRCATLIDNALEFGGVLTVLWHDRSHAPERFWGDFYLRLLRALRSLDGWFGTGSHVVSWFRKRRLVRFVDAPVDGVAHLRYEGEEIQPPLRIRVYRPRCRSNGRESSVGAPREFVDIPWNGSSADELDLQVAAGILPMLANRPETRVL